MTALRGRLRVESWCLAAPPASTVAQRVILRVAPPDRSGDDDSPQHPILVVQYHRPAAAPRIGHDQDLPNAEDEKVYVRRAERLIVAAPRPATDLRVGHVKEQTRDLRRIAREPLGHEQ